MNSAHRCVVVVVAFSNVHVKVHSSGFHCEASASAREYVTTLRRHRRRHHVLIVIF